MKLVVGWKGGETGLKKSGEGRVSVLHRTGSRPLRQIAAGQFQVPEGSLHFGPEEEGEGLWRNKGNSHCLCCYLLSFI